MLVACYDKLGPAIVTNPGVSSSDLGSRHHWRPPTRSIGRYDPRNLLGTPLIAGLSLLLCFFRYPPLPPPIRITSPSPAALLPAASSLRRSRRSRSTPPRAGGLEERIVRGTLAPFLASLRSFSFFSSARAKTQTSQERLSRRARRAQKQRANFAIGRNETERRLDRASVRYAHLRSGISTARAFLAPR